MWRKKKSNSALHEIGTQTKTTKSVKKKKMLASAMKFHLMYNNLFLCVCLFRVDKIS